MWKIHPNKPLRGQRQWPAWAWGRLLGAGWQGAAPSGRGGGWAGRAHSPTTPFSFRPPGLHTDYAPGVPSQASRAARFGCPQKGSQADREGGTQGPTHPSQAWSRHEGHTASPMRGLPSRCSRWAAHPEAHRRGHPRRAASGQGPVLDNAGDADLADKALSPGSLLGGGASKEVQRVLCSVVGGAGM